MNHAKYNNKGHSLRSRWQVIALEYPLSHPIYGFSGQESSLKSWPGKNRQKFNSRKILPYLRLLSAGVSCMIIVGADGHACPGLAT